LSQKITGLGACLGTEHDLKGIDSKLNDSLPMVQERW